MPLRLLLSTIDKHTSHPRMLKVLTHSPKFSRYGRENKFQSAWASFCKRLCTLQNPLSLLSAVTTSAMSNVLQAANGTLPIPKLEEFEENEYNYPAPGDNRFVTFSEISSVNVTLRHYRNSSNRLTAKWAFSCLLQNLRFDFAWQQTDATPH